MQIQRHKDGLLKEQAYVAFKKALLNGRIAPGSTITKAELAEVLDASTGPLRDALERLSSEGLLEILPQRGVRIAPVNLTLIKETYQFRIALEIACTQSTVQDGARAEVDALLNQTARMLAVLEQDSDPEKMSDARQIDLKLHRFIIESAGNSMINFAYDQLIDKITLIQRRGHCTRDTMIEALRDHVSILKSIQNKDVDGARNVLEHHLKTSMIKSMGL